MEISKDNYINWGWSGKQSRQDASDRYAVDFQACTRKPLSFRQECVATAQYIYETVREPLVVMMSGGIDSEIVARAFLEAKIPFRAAIFSFTPNRSREDIPWALEFCQANGIRHEIIPFDIIGFFEQDFMKSVHRYKMHEPFAAVDIRRMELVDGYPIFGNGDVYMEWHADKNAIYSVEKGSYAIPWQWQLETQRPGCWRFFKFTPEILASYMLDPVVLGWTQLAPKLGWKDNRAWKNIFAKHHWPDLKVREKLTGYERLAGDYLALQDKLKPLYSYAEDTYFLPIEKLMAQILPGQENIFSATSSLRSDR